MCNFGGIEGALWFQWKWAMRYFGRKCWRSPRGRNTRALPLRVILYSRARFLSKRNNLIPRVSLLCSSSSLITKLTGALEGNVVYYWNTKDKAKNLSRPCFGKTFCIKIYFPFVLYCTGTVYSRPVLEYLFLTKIMLHGGLLWLQLKEPTSVKGPFLTLNAKNNTVVQYFTSFPCLTISLYLRKSFRVISHSHYNLLLFLSTLNTFRVLRK